MRAASAFLPAAAAILLASLMSVAPDVRSETVERAAWRGAGESAQYALSVRGDNGNHYGWEKKDKNKRPRGGAVAVSEPPMLALIGAGLVIFGFVAWRARRKS